MKRKTRRLLLPISAAVLAFAVLVGVVIYERIPLLDLVPTPPVVIDQTWQGKTVNLLRGQHLEVRLPANSDSSSYWNLGYPVSFLSQEGAGKFTPASNPAHPGDGTQATTFRAVDVGKGPLFMDYGAGDESQTSRGRTFTVIVAVH